MSCCGSCGEVLLCFFVAYNDVHIQVLSDFVKKKDYDEQLRLEEESKAVLQKSPSTSCQVRRYDVSCVLV